MWKLAVSSKNRNKQTTTTINGIDNFLKDSSCKGKSRATHSIVIVNSRPNKSDVKTAGMMWTNCKEIYIRSAITNKITVNKLHWNNLELPSKISHFL